MDTRYWGPSGWRLLHLIVTTPLNERLFSNIKEFYTLLPFILPCKFCRQSLSKYYRDRPLPNSYAKMAKWLYNIHNDVNDKLRSQKLLKEPNPPFEKVQSDYKKWSESPCASSTILGWDFLFSVANTTPSKHLLSTPIQTSIILDSPELQNEYNTMNYKERIPYVKKWWNLLNTVLPYTPWISAWRKGEHTYGKAPVNLGKKAVLAWLFNIQKSVCKTMMEQTPYTSFNGLCKEVSLFSSGCGNSKTKATKTCRAKKLQGRKTLRQRRINGT